MADIAVAAAERKYCHGLSVMQTASTGLQPISAEVFALVEQLIDLPPAERENRLEAVKSHDAVLHARVLTLLHAADEVEAGGFLDAPRPQLVAGDTLGNYQLDIALGEGGMGQVWRAHRADGAYEAPVALKVLHGHLARGTLRERFAREGRILGALAHVRIARLLDAGVSKQRQSFLVLEYVDGQSIDQWCDARRLDLKARVAIFLQICEAVAYAHAHMVVHRDLKPSNILVTQDGVVKLLDFGIAKLLTPAATLPTHGTQLTRVGDRLLTPEYAAPEQLRGETVTSAADVYSLGVLLFELLSGAKPYRPSGPATVDLEHEILRTVPLLASQAMGAGDLSGRAADRRELRRELRGDLDTIVARAMAKDPTERYAGVHALAEDLERHLRHEPVMARRLTRRYVFGRFVRRHWLSASVGSAALLVLVLGSAAIAWQARLARIEAHKANAVKDFLLDIFNQNSLENPDPEKARQTTAQQLLDISSTKMLNSLRDAPQVRDELLDTLTELYDQLELYDKAEPLARARLADLSTGRAGDAATLAAAKLQVGRSSMMRGHFDEALTQLQGALAILDRIGDRTSANRAQTLLELGRIGYHTRPSGDPQPKLELEAASALYERCCLHNPDRFEVTQMLARIAERDGQFEEADHLYRRCLELAQLPEFRRSIPDREGAAYEDYGSFLLVRHRYREAESNMRKAVEILSRTLGPNAPETAGGAMGWLGVVLVAVNQAAQGDAMLKESVASLERSQGPDHIGWTVPIRSLAAAVQLQRGSIGEADASLTRNRSALHLDDAKGLASCPWQCPKVLGLSAMVAQAQGRLDAAAEFLDRCEQVQARLQGARLETFGLNSVARAALERLQGRTAAAAEHLAQIVEAWPASGDELPLPYLLAQLELIELALPQDAHEAATRASSLLERLLALPYHDDLADGEARTQRLAGLALLQEGKPTESEPHLRRAVQLREGMDVENSPWLAQARVDLSAALLAEHKMADVGALLAAARSAYAAQPALGPQFTEPLRRTWRQFTANKHAR
jgi:serine/threonine-protein kinase